MCVGQTIIVDPELTRRRKCNERYEKKTIGKEKKNVRQGCIIGEIVVHCVSTI
jgi:hypothetical protein